MPGTSLGFRKLTYGSQGSDVRALQDILNFHIRRLTPLKIDGNFGRLTDARVREFQRVNKLIVDGIVGPKTLGKLLQETELRFGLGLFPRLQLTHPAPPQFFPSFGGQPKLLPTLELPGWGSVGPLDVPVSLLPGPYFVLPEESGRVLAPIPDTGALLHFSITVAERSDPADPAQTSYTGMVQILDQMPLNSKFRAVLKSQVPKPKKIDPPSSGFSWGVRPGNFPIFDDRLVLKGNASFSILLTGGGMGRPTITVGAYGDWTARFRLDHSHGEVNLRAEAEVKIMALIKGTL